jgi:hypothetical protein
VIKVPHGTCFGTTDGRLLEAFCPPRYRVDLWLRWWFGNGVRRLLGLPTVEKGSVVLYDRRGVGTELRVVESRVRLPRVLCDDEARPGNDPTDSRR